MPQFLVYENPKGGEYVETATGKLYDIEYAHTQVPNLATFSKTDFKGRASALTHYLYEGDSKVDIALELGMTSNELTSTCDCTLVGDVVGTLLLNEIAKIKGTDVDSAPTADFEWMWYNDTGIKAGSMWDFFEDVDGPSSFPTLCDDCHPLEGVVLAPPTPVFFGQVSWTGDPVPACFSAATIFNAMTGNPSDGTANQVILSQDLKVPGSYNISDIITINSFSQVGDVIRLVQGNTVPNMTGLNFGVDRDIEIHPLGTLYPYVTVDNIKDGNLTTNDTNKPLIYDGTKFDLLTLTAKYVPFAGTNGQLTESASLRYDSATNTLLVGSSPTGADSLVINGRTDGSAGYAMQLDSRPNVTNNGYGIRIYLGDSGNAFVASQDTAAAVPEPMMSLTSLSTYTDVPVATLTHIDELATALIHSLKHVVEFDTGNLGVGAGVKQEFHAGGPDIKTATTAKVGELQFYWAGDPAEGNEGNASYKTGAVKLLVANNEDVSDVQLFDDALVIDAEAQQVETPYTLKVDGGVVRSLNNQTTGYGVGLDDYWVNATSGSFILTLPANGTAQTGQEYVLSNTGAGTITINTTGGADISGNASGAITLLQDESITVLNDGTNWVVKSWIT